MIRKALSFERSREGSWSKAANARAEFHLSQILKERGTAPDEAQQLASRAESILASLLPLNTLDAIEPGDEIAQFDYMQPVFDGRFVGRKLLRYVTNAPVLSIVHQLSVIEPVN